jgi:hypothetical protein
LTPYAFETDGTFVDYSGTYGITTSGNAVTLKFVTGSNVGSRIYLLQDDTNYQMFKLLNQEVSSVSGLHTPLS